MAKGPRGKVVGICQKCGRQVREKYFAPKTGLHKAIETVYATAEYSPELKYCLGKVELNDYGRRVRE